MHVSNEEQSIQRVGQRFEEIWREGLECPSCGWVSSVERAIEKEAKSWDSSGVQQKNQNEFDTKTEISGHRINKNHKKNGLFSRWK